VNVVLQKFTVDVAGPEAVMFLLQSLNINRPDAVLKVRILRVVLSRIQTSKIVTVMVNEQVAVFPEASVAVQVTIVVPDGKLLPDGGVQTAVTPGQLSLTVGAA
jgi:hypothetical protein